jgi:hypothetical protein
MEFLVAGLAIIALLCVVALFLGYSIAAWAFVVMKYWVWFLTMPFGFAAITFSQSVAVSMLIGLVAIRCYHPTNEFYASFKSDPENPDPYKWEKVITAVISPWVILVVGWAVKCWFISVPA